MLKARSWPPAWVAFRGAARSPRTTAAPVPATDTRLYGFDWMRCFAIVAVVCIHVTDIALRKNDYFPTMTPEGVAYHAFSASLRFCVPVFFMMSAFLVETRALRGGPSPASRWKRYLVPLGAATVVYTLSTVAVAVALHKPIAPLELAVMAVIGHAGVHTWFLVNLFVYALLHDGLRLLAGRAFPFVAGAYALLFALTNGRAGPFGGSTPWQVALTPLVMAVPYYAAGIWAAHHLERLQAIATPAKLLAVGAGGALSVGYGVFLRELSYYNPATLLFAGSLFLLALSIRKRPPALVHQLAAFSLGIYLWHLLVLLAARALEGRLYREVLSPLITLELVLAETVAALVGGLLIALLLSRSTRLRSLAM